MRSKNGSFIPKKITIPGKISHNQTHVNSWTTIDDRKTRFDYVRERIVVANKRVSPSACFNELGW